MRLAAFILRDTESILGEWEAFASTLFPAAASMTPLALRDHAKQILEAVAKDLSTPQTKQAQADKSLGRALKLMEAPETAAQTHAVARRQQRQRRAPATRPAREPRVELRLLSRPHGRRQGHQGLQRDRRVHARVPDDRGAASHHRGRGGVGVEGVDGAARRARARALRQRARVRLLGGARLAQAVEGRAVIHRTGQSVGERVRRVVPRAAARRAAVARGVRHVAGGAGDAGGVAAGVQSGSSARRVGLPGPRGLRGRVSPDETNPTRATSAARPCGPCAAGGRSRAWSSPTRCRTTRRP